MSNITYTYKHCNKEDLKKDYSFNEEEFSKSLEKIFQTHVKVDRVEVDFTCEGSSESPRFLTVIKVISSEIDYNHREEGYEPSEVVRKAIRNAIEYVREQPKPRH